MWFRKSSNMLWDSPHRLLAVATTAQCICHPAQRVSTQHTCAAVCTWSQHTLPQPVRRCSWVMQKNKDWVSSLNKKLSRVITSGYDIHGATHTCTYTPYAPSTSTSTARTGNACWCFAPCCNNNRPEHSQYEHMHQQPSGLPLDLQHFQEYTKPSNTRCELEGCMKARLQQKSSLQKLQHKSLEVLGHDSRGLSDPATEPNRATAGLPHDRYHCTTETSCQQACPASAST